MSKKLSRIEPIAQDAWGDVPNLGADFVAPDTCHGLHKRIAELERERATDTFMPCGHARRYIYSANPRAEITTSLCLMCAFVDANSRIAALEAERNEAQARSGAKSIALEDLRAELDAAVIPTIDIVDEIIDIVMRHWRAGDIGREETQAELLKFLKGGD